ncbi:MAG: hypothetical protein TREMPRED_003948, partial [Tremellales sp. Tagirdzhanova-0007]
EILSDSPIESFLTILASSPTRLQLRSCVPPGIRAEFHVPLLHLVHLGPPALESAESVADHYDSEQALQEDTDDGQEGEMLEFEDDDDGDEGEFEDD